jgi:hypothetical protein
MRQTAFKGVFRLFIVLILVPVIVSGVFTPSLVIAEDAAPEIYISSHHIEIGNGDSTPSVTDYTDYGMAAAAGGSVMHMFNIHNSGTADLHLTGSPAVVISGPNAADFTVINTVYTTVRPGGNWPAMIDFHPSAPGLRSATISVANDDSDENPYTFSIQGTSAENLPEILITGNGLEIMNYYNSESTADGTDFGSIGLTGETVVRTFIINNPGSAPLNLTGNPLVAISGAHAADFTVTSLPVSPVANGGSTPFQITFAPSGIGKRTATVTVSNDDSDENTYTFDICGTGSGYNIWVNHQGTNIANGDTTPSTIDFTDFGTAAIGGSVVHDFYITNSGTLPVALTGGSPYIFITGTNAADFTVTRIPPSTINPGIGTLFDITFRPSALGLRSAIVSIPNNDPAKNPYTFCIQGTGGNAPEICVRGNGFEITDGDTVSSLDDFTDFGSTAIPSAGIVRNFNIFNTGLAPLNLTGTPLVTISGANAADFNVTSMPVSPIPAGSSSSFQITFSPSSSGVKNAAVSISNDDGNENPYNFSLRGIGGTGKIKITGNGLEIINGDTTPSATDGTDLGGADILYTMATVMFNVYNTGSATLYFSGTPMITLSGPDAADFYVRGPHESSVASGGYTYFYLDFNPHTIGVKHAVISIASNDPTASPFTFSVQGLATAAVLSVTGNSRVINTGDMAPSTEDFTDFGTIDIGSEGVVHTFTITNSGSGAVDLFPEYPYIGVGRDYTDFTITSIASNHIPAGGSLTFQITFRPTAAGLRSANIMVINDKSEMYPYEFRVQGTGAGTTPEIGITGNDREIWDGDTSPHINDFTDFGSVDVTSGSRIRSFTIRNTGSAALNLTGTPVIAISGPHAADFTVTTQPVSPVAKTSGSTFFEITFRPSASGLRNATVTIISNDIDENPFTFNIQGTGTNVTDTRITSALYNASTGVLTVTGANLLSFTGANNDIDASKFTFTGEGGETYTLTDTADADISGPTSFTLTLSETDRVNVNPIMNLAGFTSTGGTAYNLAAAEDWAAGVNPSTNIADMTGNPVTATQIPNPQITSAVYDDYQGTLLVTGTGFKKASGRADIDVSRFYITGNNHSSLAFSDAPDVELLTATTFKIILTETERNLAGGFMDKDGAFASDGTAYNLFAEDDWNTGAEPGLYIVDPDIALTVTVTGPEIVVSVNNNVIEDGGTYDFGNIELNVKVDAIFTIKNTGKANLALPSAIIIENTFYYFHVIVEPPVQVVAPGQSTTFTVRFSPTKTGVLTASLRFNNSDLNEASYNIALSGTGLASTTTTNPTVTPVQGMTDVGEVINDTGLIEDWVFAHSTDNKAEIRIDPGVVALDSSRDSLETISIVPVTALQPPRNWNLIGQCYILGPDGATFEPEVTLTLIYDPDNLPDGTIEDKLYIAFYDDSAYKWVKLVSTVDPLGHTVCAKLTHFSTYAIMSEKPVIPTPTPTGTSSPTVTLTPTPLSTTLPVLTVEPGPEPTTTSEIITTTIGPQAPPDANKDSAWSQINWVWGGGIIGVVIIVFILVILLLRRR